MDRAFPAFPRWPAGWRRFRASARGWLIVALVLASWLLLLGAGLGIMALLG